MARGASEGEVVVSRDEDGTVHVTGGPVATSDFTRAVLDVTGAVLTWPVLGGAGLPTAEIHDVQRAQQWLWVVYGEQVAAAVHACAVGELASARVATEPTALASSAARLGFGHWAARWWPASHLDGIPTLQPDVLGLELAALTHTCQQLFDADDDQPDDCAAELIGDHEAGLDTLIQWWHSTPPSSDTARRLRARSADGRRRGGRRRVGRGRCAISARPWIGPALTALRSMPPRCSHDTTTTPSPPVNPLSQAAG